MEPILQNQVRTYEQDAFNLPGCEERLMILRMLEESKISVEEAESLLGALDS